MPIRLTTIWMQEDELSLQFLVLVFGLHKQCAYRADHRHQF